MSYNSEPTHFVTDLHFTGKWGSSNKAACGKRVLWSDNWSHDSKKVYCSDCKKTKEYKNDVAEWKTLKDLLERYGYSDEV